MTQGISVWLVIAPEYMSMCVGLIKQNGLQEVLIELLNNWKRQEGTKADEGWIYNDVLIQYGN